MRNILIIALMCFGLIAAGQSNLSPIITKKVPNATTAFNEALPISSIIVNSDTEATTKVYVVKASNGVASTRTITTALGAGEIIAVGANYDLGVKADTATTVNGHRLSGNITLDQDDIGNGTNYVQTENNFSDSHLSKLNGIEAGAEVNVQTDFDQTNNAADDYLKGRDKLLTDADTTSLLETQRRADSTNAVRAAEIAERLDSTASISRFDIDSIWTSRGQTFISQGGVIDSTGQERVSVGDFYGGGYVFYVSPDGTWGISAYTSNIYYGVWEVDPKAIKGAYGTAIGTGENNTNTIVAAEGAGTYAAKQAADFSGGGYSDWYLPSLVELDSIYHVLEVGGIVDYSLNYVWSSSEYQPNPTNLAGCIDFRDGTITEYFTKAGPAYTIPVRTWFIEGESTLPAGDAGDMLYNTGGAWTTLPIGADNTILKVNGTTPNWEADAGGGTVTNFSAGDLSPLFTTSEATTTTTPALTFTLTNQTQNKVYASPNGSTGAPAFRVLVAADFPSSGVSPGSYTNTNITVDAYGRVTSAANGSASGYTLPVSTPYALGGFQVFENTAGYYMSGNYLVVSSDKYNAGTPTTGSYVALWNGSAMIKSTVADVLALGGGGTVVVQESDLSPSLSASIIRFANATVSDLGGGVALVTPTGGSGATNISITSNSTSVSVNSDTGSDGTISGATSSLAGVLSAADKYKLDQITVANLVTLTGTQTLTNKTLTTPTLSATASGTTAGRLGYSSGLLSYGTGTNQRTLVTLDGTETLTNKSVNGVTLSTAQGTTYFLRGDGSYAAPPTGLWNSDTEGIYSNNNVGIGSFSDEDYKLKVAGQMLVTNNIFCDMNIWANINSSVNAGYFSVKQYDSATTYVTVIDESGFLPPSLTDAQASNNRIYYSTTQSKLVYKNSAGTVNVLY